MKSDTAESCARFSSLWSQRQKRSNVVSGLRPFGTFGCGRSLRSSSVLLGSVECVPGRIRTSPWSVANPESFAASPVTARAS
jgi:hypothetical protein